VSFQPGTHPVYRYRALTYEQERAVRDAMRRGANAKALATAYGCHVRTIYRTLDRGTRKPITVRLGDYQAVFELDEGIPVQTTPWVPV
jgi:DNA invertase Pin-like site-specific DNA recombinase